MLSEVLQATPTHAAAAPMQYAAVTYLSASEEVKSLHVPPASHFGSRSRLQLSEPPYRGRGESCETTGWVLTCSLILKVIRCALANHGITTAQQMCDAIFEEVSVALMPGGPAFLRPVEELTVRLCFVNFDGSVCIEG
ncbi:hypothetical protein OS493_014767 [Desmophyllum pertusum]|uniref:Uncharacterized protein n=1 Tax=Desmophyllum pertusum TaxID=174260 RepID=A0A9W9YD53_9CNID|nr:hypothetical protein OS493_014767 [Desmophyllum pertusum]